MPDISPSEILSLPRSIRGRARNQHTSLQWSRRALPPRPSRCHRDALLAELRPQIEPVCEAGLFFSDNPASSVRLVGVTGFEPATSCSQSRRATGLRHTPKCELGDWRGSNSHLLVHSEPCEPLHNSHHNVRAETALHSSSGSLTSLEGCAAPDVAACPSGPGGT